MAEAILQRAKARELPAAEILFDYAQYEGKVTVLEPFVGRAGWLTLSRFSVEALDQAEDHLIFSAFTDASERLEDDLAVRMLGLPGALGIAQTPSPEMDSRLNGDTQERRIAIHRKIGERNAQFFEAEAEKLDGWADDLKLGLEREIKDFDRRIKDARKGAAVALTLEEKLSAQKQIRGLENERKDKRKSLFEAQDAVDKQRDELIAQIEGKLQQSISTKRLFAVRWRLN